MRYVAVDADYAAAAQIAPGDAASIAALGYRALMCNRPDGEEPGQPAFAEIAQAAHAAGLVTAHVPVISGRITPADVAAFRDAMAALPGPVFAYCRSGSRCQHLRALAG